MGTIQSRASDGGDLSPSRSGLADALFTRTQQAVLGLLFGHPERSYYLSEIIAHARVGRSGVQREVARLRQAGLIERQVIGNQTHYRANRQSPVFLELAGLIRKTTGLADPLRESLRVLEGRTRVTAIFGSVTRGADTATSDLDLLVVSDSLTLEELIRALEPAERAIARRINPVMYTTEEFQRRRARNAPFLAKLLASDPVVLTGSLHDLLEPRTTGRNASSEA
jgi:predicted nucleotidyltransferase